jgi:hypothetical protein
MSAESTKTAKMSKHFSKLKKFFLFGSRSTSQSRSDSHSPSVAPLGIAASSPPIVAMPALVSLPPPVDAIAPVYSDRDIIVPH